MVMRQPFTTASPVLVNYNYIDVANGTGYEEYYLIESEDSAGKDYHLTSNRDYSNSINITMGVTTSDIDYDLTPFTIPRTLNGIVLFSIPIFHETDGECAAYTLELYRWDGTTETQIGSSITFTPTTTAPNQSKILYMRMPVVNSLIPAGESLRLRVKVVNSVTTAVYGIDPAGRAGTPTGTTTFKISVPYKLDL